MKTKSEKFRDFVERYPVIGLPVLVALLMITATFLSGVAVLGYQDLQIISAPGNPASGYLRFFGTTGALNCLTSGGASCFPSGFTAGGDLSGSSTSQTVIKVNGGSIPASATFAATNSSSQITALTATQATAALNAFTSSLQGVAPSSGGGTTNFLRADGSWAAPPGSGGGGGMTQIAQVVVSGSSTTDISFTSIAGTYTSLYVVLQGISSTTNYSETVDVTFNSDSAAHYGWQQVYSSGSTTTSIGASAQSKIQVCGVSGDVVPSNIAGYCIFTIPNYAAAAGSWGRSASFEYAIFTSDLLSTSLLGKAFAYWTGTAAITRIDMIPDSGSHYLAGTVATLYGLQ